MEIRDAHALAPRDAAIRTRALDGGGRAQALDQAVEYGGQIEREQKAGQVVTQALQGQRAIEAHSPARGIEPFDRVNHDRLMVRLKQHCPDPTLLRLINRYLKAGVRIAGHTEASTLADVVAELREPLLLDARTSASPRC